jgi:homoserine dehydrogenase
VDIAKAGAVGPVEDSFMVRALGKTLPVKSIFSILSRYYLRFYVIDKPSVLANISKILGKYKISISDVMQRERSAGRVVPLILLTHDTHEKDLRAAIREIDRMSCIKGRTQVIRIEEA